MNISSLTFEPIPEGGQKSRNLLVNIESSYRSTIEKITENLNERYSNLKLCSQSKSKPKAVTPQRVRTPLVRPSTDKKRKKKYFQKFIVGNSNSKHLSLSIRNL